MSRHWTPKRRTVELGQPAEQRPSRIRREPPPKGERRPSNRKGDLQWRSSDREIWVAMTGIVAFALAINIVILAIGIYWD